MDAHGVGDPLADVARVSMAGHDVLAAFLDGYRIEPRQDLDERLRAHRILWNLDALAFEYRAGGDWFDAYRRNISTDLDRVGS